MQASSLKPGAFFRPACVPAGGLALLLAAAFATGCSSSALPPVTPPPDGAVLSMAEQRLPASGRTAPAVDEVAALSPLNTDWIFVQIPGFSGNLAGLVPLPGFYMTKYGNTLRGNTSCNPMLCGFNLDVVAGTLNFTNLVDADNFCQRANSDADEAIINAMLATDGFQIVSGKLQLMSKGTAVAILAPK
jgi:hypothetical protein